MSASAYDDRVSAQAKEEKPAIVVWAPIDKDSDIRKLLKKIADDPKVSDALTLIATEHGLDAINIIVGSRSPDSSGEKIIFAEVNLRKIGNDLGERQAIAAKIKELIGTSTDVIAMDERKAGIPKARIHQFGYHTLENIHDSRTKETPNRRGGV
ncbi:MAG: hypothetical protein AABY33_10080 [Pseudomonadota bacterium]